MAHPPDATPSTASISVGDRYSFEAEFANHRQALQDGDMDRAIQSFILLKTSSADNEAFRRYLIELVDHIDPAKDSSLSQFFASLPALIQSTVIEDAAECLEGEGDLHKFQIFYDYIQAYPRHAYKYLTRAIQLLIACADGDQADRCIHLLVNELLPRFWKQRVLIADQDVAPTVKSTDSKHFIKVPYPLFEQYLMIGQRYYIRLRDWKELTRFTCAMLECCGYVGYARLDTCPHLERFQYLREHRANVTLEDATEQRSTSPVVALMCEYLAVTAQFVESAYGYYRAVCALDAQGEEKTCLIPICAVQSSASSDCKAEETSNNSREQSMEEDTDLPDGASQQNDTSLAEEGRQYKKQRLDVPDRDEGLNAFCMRGVDDALFILSEAADCMRHIVELWQWVSTASPQVDWAGVYRGWEEELCRVLDDYKLPFDLCNAVLLVRSDLALSSPSVPGNLAKALKLSQIVCDRIELQRRKDRKASPSAANAATTTATASSAVPSPSIPSPSHAPPSELDIPFMFAFRVLYNIGVIYLLVGSLQQSTLEIAIILSVFPIPSTLDERDFVADERDCQTAAGVFQGREFGMMRVTQEGLVVRCIKHLIVSLDNEATMRGGMASIDSAMRWDEKAGSMIVLMQYGWPYWSTRTNFWPKIVHRMREKRSFKNREFLEYIYVPDILKTIRMLHESQQVVMDIIPPEFALRGSYRHLPGTTSSSSTPSSPSQPNATEPSPTTSTSTTSTTTTTTPTPTPTPTPTTTTSSSTPAAMAATTSTAPTTTSAVTQCSPPPPPSELISPSGDDATHEKVLPPLASLPGKTLPPIYQPPYGHSGPPNLTMSPSWYTTSTQKGAQNRWMSPSFYYSRPTPSLSKDGEDPADGEPTSPVSRTGLPPDVVNQCLDYRLRKFSPKMTSQRMRHVLQRFLKTMVLNGNEDA